MTVPQIPGTRVRTRRGGSVWQVTASGPHVLQQLAVTSVGAATITELDVTVDAWYPPVAGWLGPVGIAGVESVRVECDGRAATVRIETTGPTDVSVLLAAAVRCLRPTPTGDVGPMLTFAPGLPIDAAPLAARLVDVLVPGQVRDRHVRRCDTLVTPGTESGVERSTTITVGATRWERDGVAFDVDVDPTVHRPVGRRSTGGATATAAMADGRLCVRATDLFVDIGSSVGPADARALRGTRAVITDDEVPTRIARQLTACGVVVRPGSAALPEPGDDLGWQAMSVRERRHALRQFSPATALDAWPTVSVVMATNRADHLDHAMGQLAGLRYPRLEIVIGAHGDTIDSARVWKLAQQVPHPVRLVSVGADRNLGDVLQACSDRAEGALITKMDDDDFYGPDHIWDLVLAREYSGAQVVGKALDWIYLESEGATVFRPTYPAEKYADFVAGGTILISRADLLAIGGWRPVPKSVDRALLDRVLETGGLVYRTHGLGYVYVRRESGHTAAVRDEHFLTKVTARHEGLVRHEAFGTGVAGAGASDPADSAE